MGVVLGSSIAATAAAGTGAVVGELGDVPVYESTDNTVVRVTFSPQTAQAAEGATNFAVLQVRDVTQANKVLASVNIGTTALTAETEVDLVLGADLKIAQKDVLDVFVAQTGTGGAVPAGKVQVELE